MCTTFAWFTGKDEVTNRLSASADYGVSIAENFQPPENWVPGQKINKDVSVVNTGNVDAFARVWLTGEMKVLNTTALLDGVSDVFGSFPANPKANATTEQKLIDLDLTGYKTDNNERYYYKQLSVAQTTNPENDGDENSADGYKYDGTMGTNTPTGGSAPSTPNSTSYSEVQSIQAGGYLVSAPANAEYEYVTNQETRMKIFVTKTVTPASGSDPAVTQVVEEWVDVPAGYLVKVVKEATSPATNPSSGTIDYTTGDVTLDVTDTAVRGTTAVSTVYVKAASTFTPVYVDAETFAPTTVGTYIFARNVDQKPDTADSGVVMTVADLDDYEFSGYYFDAVLANGTTAGKGGYWALKNADADGSNRSDYTLPKKYNKKITASGADNYVGDGTVSVDNAVLTLVFDNGGELASVTPTDKLEMYTAKYAQVENDALKWVYDNGTLSAIYQGGTNLAAADNTPASREKKLRDDIVVDVKLANVGAATQQWTVISDEATDGTKVLYYNTYTNGAYDTSSAATELAANRLWTFYYNDDVESGDTTSKLVDSVSLRETTKKDAFIAFDFDLNVNMESVQVTMDENGQEMVTPVTTWAASTGNTGAYAADYQNYLASATTSDYDGTEIAQIQWDATDVSTYTAKAD